MVGWGAVVVVVRVVVGMRFGSVVVGVGVGVVADVRHGRDGL